MFDVNKFAKMQVGLASPEEIKSWATREVPSLADPTIKETKLFEVTKPETVNYRTQKPEPDGLFCERIFGPSKDFECHCGKYRKKAYAGLVCEKCGVEITTKSVRRDRMSCICLAAPVAHIWYLKGSPSRMAQLLDVSAKDLEEVVYFISNITLSAEGCPLLNKREILDEKNAKQRFTEIIQLLINDGQIAPGSMEEAKAIEYINDMATSSVFDFSSISSFIKNYYPKVSFGMGAEAVQQLLSEIDIEKEFNETKEELNKIKGEKNAKKIKLQKRLEALEAFKNSGNRPEWMILDVLPVIPPELRPMLPLDGGRFASTDLNDLYQRVIQRNIGLKSMLEIDAPTVMITNAKRMLQEAVDALIDNGRRSKPVMANNKRQYKSLSQTLKGKQGRFRQNLLGKRVDYSGRSVIAVGPDLKMDQCGLPREMAVQLFKPFIAQKLVEKGYSKSIKGTEALFESSAPEMWEVLDEVVATHPVLLNRAPTLHRLGIQAFHPKLVEGRAIRLFPLATTAFNADFDGDQMAIHVPLSNEAIEEAETLMLGSKNILGPKDGKSIVTPTKDMVLGNYFLTMEESAADFMDRAKEAREWNNIEKAERYELFARSEGKVFSTAAEAIVAYQTRQIHLHTRIAVKVTGVNALWPKEQIIKRAYILTTPGKIIFNKIFDGTYPFLNDPDNLTGTSEENFAYPGENLRERIINRPLIRPFSKGDLSHIIDEFLKVHEVADTAEMLNKMKDQGFKYATDSAVTVALSDILVLDDKKSLYKDAEKQVENFEAMYNEGLLTNEERSKHVIKVWEDTTKNIGNEVKAMFASKKTNPFSVMKNSGAGGNDSHFNQLAGMRGLMRKPNGSVIELPIKSSFREGLSVSEFFMATHGTRKGGADTALKTAESGYLTRRLVDVSQDVVVKVDDCCTTHGTVVEELRDLSDGTVVEKFFNRIWGRYAFEDIKDGDRVIVAKNELITESKANEIIAAGINRVTIRTLFDCKVKNGVCRKCYGVNLATGKEVEYGEAVGIIAAQSIGEPGTQLTMRNFNTGGVAGASDITRGLPRVQELFEARNPKGKAVLSLINGKIEEISDTFITVVNDLGDKKVHNKSSLDKLAKYLEDGKIVLPARELRVGDKVAAGQRLTEGAVYPRELLEITNNPEAVEKYILEEVQKVYASQNIDISDKHIELISRQMFKKMVVTDQGDTNLIPGKKISIDEFNAANREALLAHKDPCKAHSIVLGITKASINVDSFLSAASFQETTRVLTDAAVKGKVDTLQGLKENVIIGKLIPSGTGLREDRRWATPELSEKKYGE